eukprot:TRINITY_DN3987_c5_g1_i1.p1 TRINITY_DN3987_c5_g1~~TRINITY_DN3987_c5_g1_i1.p1  ORF type:complete len:797 (+),score=130.41 TRINITY_DN3987_c5_g1_i1:104-2494(+)
MLLSTFTQSVQRSRAMSEVTASSSSESSSSSSSGKRLKPRERTPWLVPYETPVELIFFRKVFAKLSQQTGATEASGVPLICLQRSMCRFCKVLQDSRTFDAKRYDQNSDGTVGWWEFCMLWKEEQFVVRYSMAERIFLTLEDPHRSKLGKLTSLLVLFAILMSAGGFIISTMPSMKYQECPTCEPKPFHEFEYMDTVCVLLFTFEYMLRLVTSAYMRSELINEEELIESLTTDTIIRLPNKWIRVRQFVLAWPNLIDAVAILPFYIALLIDIFAPAAGKSEFFPLIRLMRVVRAFRLGRRFEAVVIIARAMRRSVRALWVLMLNVSLGMLIFGAVLFFLEQGEYDADTKSWQRVAGYRLNEAGDGFETFRERSPYGSIPESFWWALVTSTTVGYGDVYPTSYLGKILAGLAMVWSLVVVALPVGVIGHNFQTVWLQYDAEKQRELELKDGASKMAKLTLGSIDPLSYSRMLHIEVYHDAGIGFGHANDMFIGEAEMELSLDASEASVTSHQLWLPLVENRKKTNRKVSGELNLAYKWIPTEHTIPGTVLKGELIITVISARRLASVDWKHSGRSDPYVTLTVYPDSPSATDGTIKAQVERTRTVFDEVEPMWNEIKSFDFHWHQDGVSAKRELERKNAAAVAAKLAGMINPATVVVPPRNKLRALREKQFTAPSNEEDSKAKPEYLAAAGKLVSEIPQMQREIAALKTLVPQLNDEVKSIRESMSSIMFELGLTDTRRTTDVPEPTVTVTAPSPPDPRLLSPGRNFTMPGSVLEDAEGFQVLAAKDLESTVTMMPS